jgi:hypothetical protein
MTTHQAAHVAVLEVLQHATSEPEVYAALTAAIAAMKQSREPVGAIDETGEPYLYLSTDLPRGTLLYAAPTEASR